MHAPTARAGAEAGGGHAHGLADEADGVALGGLRADADHALDAGRQAQAEAREEGGQEAAGDEGHDDEGEDLVGVLLGVVDEVAPEALDLLHCLVEEAGARGALVVGRGAAWFCGLVGLFERIGYVLHVAGHEEAEHRDVGHGVQRHDVPPKPKKPDEEREAFGMPKKLERDELCFL